MLCRISTKAGRPRTIYGEGEEGDGPGGEDVGGGIIINNEGNDGAINVD